MGLIDTLSSGFKVVQRRPWLILPPVLLDLWLWLGPRWSIQPLVDRLLSMLSPANLPAELAQAVEPYHQVLIGAGENYNLWWLADNNPTWLRAAMPGLVEPARLSAGLAIVETSVLALALAAPLLLLLGVALGSIFLAAISSQLPALQASETKSPAAPATSNPPAPAPQPASFWLRRSWRTFILTALFGLLLIVLLMVTSVLLSLMLTPIFLMAPQAGAGAASLAALLIGWLTVVAYFMFYFVLAAIVIDGVGLWQAMWRSFNVVYRNFWTTLGLLVLITLILWGFGLIWQRLATASVAGAVAAIAGNGVLITGLTAARLIYYRERSARWLDTLSAPQAADDPHAKS